MLKHVESIDTEPVPYKGLKRIVCRWNCELAVSWQKSITSFFMAGKIKRVCHSRQPSASLLFAWCVQHQAYKFNLYLRLRGRRLPVVCTLRAANEHIIVRVGTQAQVHIWCH
jgi:hypothetical protein